MTAAKRALVTLPDGVWKVIDQELKGQIGDGDSEVIRNIVISFLTEKGYLLKSKKVSSDGMNAKSIEKINDIVITVQSMINVLFETLKANGLVSGNEFDGFPERIIKYQKKYKKMSKNLTE